MNTWHQGAIDHAINDTDGYMIVFNLANTHPVVYTQTFRQLYLGQWYEISLYIANVIALSANQTNLIARLNVGDIAAYNSLTWTQYAISFGTPTSAVDVILIAQTSGGSGADFAIDDILFRTCSTNNLTICP